MHCQRNKSSAIVVAVGRSHDGVRVKLRRPLVGQHYSGMVLVFGEKYGTLDAEVKRVIVPGATDPAEPGFIKVFVDSVQLGM